MCRKGAKPRRGARPGTPAKGEKSARGAKGKKMIRTHGLQGREGARSVKRCSYQPSHSPAWQCY
jgi:hypothetical protein